MSSQGMSQNAEVEYAATSYGEGPPCFHMADRHRSPTRLHHHYHFNASCNTSQPMASTNIDMCEDSMRMSFSSFALKAPPPTLFTAWMQPYSLPSSSTIG